MTGLPRGWEWTSVREIAELHRGVTFKKGEALTTSAPGLVPIIRAGNVQDGRVALDKDLVWVPTDRVAPQQILRRSDIVVATSSGSLSVVGKSALLEHDWSGAHGAFMTVIRPSKSVEGRYLGSYLQTRTVRAAWSAAAAGTSINNLKVGDLLETRVPLAPIEEQERIVAAIEEYFSRLDAADAVLTAAERRTEVLDWRALRVALEQEGAWPEVQVKEIAQLSLGKMLDKKQQTGLHPTPYLRNINVRWNSFATDDLATMDVSPREFERASVRNGDVVMCEGGEPGRCAVWRGEPTAIQKALHRIRPSDRVLPEFLTMVFGQMARSGALSRHFTGTTIKHLPKERLAEIRFQLPPLVFQEKAVSRARSLQSATSRVAGELTGARQRGVALRHSILAAAFSGRLVLQDSNDEPALVLLERIRADRSSAASKKRRQKVKTS